MQRSWFTKLWHSVRPPSAVESAESELSEADKLRRRRLVMVTVAVIVTAGGGWEAYQYISSAPARAAKVLQDGVVLMGKGDLKGAEKGFSKAVSIWPKLASGYLQRGLVRSDLQDPDGAIADFEHALALDPKLAAAHTGLGVIYLRRGDTAGAEREYTTSIQIEPDTDVLYERGHLYASLGEQEKALTDFDAAIHQQPDAPFVYRARAMSRDALGDHDGAEDDRAQANRLEHH